MKQFAAGFLIAGIIALFWSSTLRSDVREMRKMKDSLIVENAKLDNTVKTKDACIQSLNACETLKDKTIASHVATINTQIIAIGKLERKLTASLTAYKQLKDRYSQKSMPKTYKKKRTRKIYKKPVNKLSLQQKRNIREKIYAIKRKIKVHQTAANNAKYAMITSNTMTSGKKEKHNKKTNNNFFGSQSSKKTETLSKSQKREKMKEIELQKVKELKKELEKLRAYSY